ncbi:4a-hydroxytetrahydrobiopterin dehydratase [Streptomyces pacificus]|uniref:Putative pterin-4-alpha-carbinolamine dehydratase n=1 Tax=Streptomyces pacificus TaxID=2705029 RepID=A0A6A0AXT3_9ACTN|nr:4a-hydroxytetrahydrobiopterin dehydratase [Streptomyces pacificus]GFH36784.1 4a-hydroxytetrahydrobiopterin dehydratase [Streptomyces pacificus]
MTANESRTDDGFPPTDHRACQGSAVTLDTAAVQRRLGRVPEWELRQGHLCRTFHCVTFRQSLALVEAIADIAEKLNHHPNLSWENKREVTVVLWTHKMDGLTGLDFDLAADIDTAYSALQVPV